MSLLTKLLERLGITRKTRMRPAPKFAPGRKPPDDTEGSAGVTAKLHPLPPTLSGANARAFPPED